MAGCERLSLRRGAAACTCMCVPQSVPHAVYMFTYIFYPVHMRGHKVCAVHALPAQCCAQSKAMSLPSASKIAWALCRFRDIPTAITAGTGWCEKKAPLPPTAKLKRLRGLSQKASGAFFSHRHPRGNTSTLDSGGKGGGFFFAPTGLEVISFHTTCNRNCLLATFAAE